MRLKGASRFQDPGGGRWYYFLATPNKVHTWSSARSKDSLLQLREHPIKARSSFPYQVTALLQTSRKIMVNKLSYCNGIWITCRPMPFSYVRSDFLLNVTFTSLNLQIPRTLTLRCWQPKKNSIIRNTQEESSSLVCVHNNSPVDLYTFIIKQLDKQIIIKHWTSTLCSKLFHRLLFSSRILPLLILQGGARCLLQ